MNIYNNVNISNNMNNKNVALKGEGDYIRIIGSSIILSN